MKPDPPKVLRGIISQYLKSIGPELKTPFSQGNFGQGLMLLNIIAQEYDRAAARLVEEDNAIIPLLEDGLLVVADESLASRLRDAVDGDYHRDLHVSALERENNLLRGLLTELHAVVEMLESPEAVELNERIWAELQQSTRRRHVVSRLA
jgi:hypothetical protein